MVLVKIEPEALAVFILMIILPVIVFGYFHLKNSDFFDKFKRKKKDGTDKN